MSSARVLSPMNRPHQVPLTKCRVIDLMRVGRTLCC